MLRLAGLQYAVMACLRCQMVVCYTVRPLTASFGGVVEGFSFASALDDAAFVDNLKRDVQHHRLLWFRKAHLASGELARLAAAMGSVWDRPDIYPTRPHPSIARHSNDDRYGYKHTACAPQHRARPWHVEGLHMHSPFRYTVFEGITKGRHGGGTVFLPLRELVEAQPPRVRREWKGLLMETWAGTTHPLLYRHPVSGEPTLALHMHENLASSFIDSVSQTRKSVQDVFAKLNLAIEAHTPLNIDWEAGDVIIVDNMAVAHRAPDDDDIDLRILDHIDVFEDTMPPTMSFAYSIRSGNHSETASSMKRLPALAGRWEAPVSNYVAKVMFGAGLRTTSAELFYSFYSAGDPCSCPISVPQEIKCPSGMGCVTVSSNETMRGHLNATTNRTVIEQCCEMSEVSGSALALKSSRQSEQIVTQCLLLFASTCSAFV